LLKPLNVKGALSVHPLAPTSEPGSCLGTGSPPQTAETAPGPHASCRTNTAYVDSNSRRLLRRRYRDSRTARQRCYLLLL